MAQKTQQSPSATPMAKRNAFIAKVEAIVEAIYIPLYRPRRR